MRTLRWRRVISLSLLLLGMALACTGVMLYLAPSGRIAYWTDWHLLGLDKDQLGAMHTIGALACVILSVLHAWYNWKAIVTYLRDKAQRLRVATPEMEIACVLTLVLEVGPALALPPFAQVMDAGEAVKGWWEAREGSPPYGHAELSSLSTVAAKLELEEDDAVARLSGDGWVVGSAELSLLDIARENDRSPAALYSVLTKQGGAAASPAYKGGKGRGGGRGKLGRAD
jgi:hypothetical protein